jgi:hypothetical protein
MAHCYLLLLSIDFLVTIIHNSVPLPQLKILRHDIRYRDDQKSVRPPFC